MSHKTLEECRKLFEDNDNPQVVIDSIWSRHWNNAKNSNDITVLQNLLKNHVRLLNEMPERNNGKEREIIIQFIREKISGIQQN
jgi:hypothetical protein